MSLFFKFLSDIDECNRQNLNTCEGKCLNNDGNYTCSCDYGFKIENFSKCVKGINYNF